MVKLHSKRVVDPTHMKAYKDTPQGVFLLTNTKMNHNNDVEDYVAYCEDENCIFARAGNVEGFKEAYQDTDCPHCGKKVIVQEMKEYLKNEPSET